MPKEVAEQAESREVVEALESERKLFDLRKAARSGQKAQLRQRVVQLREEIGGIEAQQKAKAQEIVLIHRELVGVNDLWEKKLVPLNRVMNLEREATRLEGERGQLIAAAAQTKGKMSEIELQIIQIDQDVSSEVANQLRDIDSKIGELVERKLTAEDQLRRIDIRAPQDGLVFQSTVHTVGGVIAAGDAIMIIVPEADILAAEIKVDPKDIDRLQIGQPAVLRFVSFDHSMTPEITGAVRRISADASMDQRTGASFFTARISMTAEELARLGNVKMTPGMPVEAFVNTGSRTVISYLVKPLHDQFKRALREE
jgi:HlyD family secretion protein